MVGAMSTILLTPGALFVLTFPVITRGLTTYNLHENSEKNNLKQAKTTAFQIPETLGPNEGRT